MRKNYSCFSGLYGGHGLRLSGKRLISEAVLQRSTELVKSLNFFCRLLLWFQHYEHFLSLLEKLGGENSRPSVALLTGSTPSKSQLIREACDDLLWLDIC